MSEPAPPYGPGAICEECGHFAGRHGDGDCQFPREPGHGCRCAGLLWLGVRWRVPATGLPVRAEP